MSEVIFRGIDPDTWIECESRSVAINVIGVLNNKVNGSFRGKKLCVVNDSGFRYFKVSSSGLAFGKYIGGLSKKDKVISGEEFVRLNNEIRNDFDQPFKQYDPLDGINEVFDTIRIERVRQFNKFGFQDRSPVEWISILAEEVGEAAQQANEFHFSDNPDPKYLEGFKEEIKQVAAVAIQILQILNNK